MVFEKKRANVYIVVWENVKANQLEILNGDGMETKNNKYGRRGKKTLREGMSQKI